MFEFDVCPTDSYSSYIGTEVWLDNGVLITYFEEDYPNHVEKANKAKKMLDELVKFGLTEQLQEIRDYYSNVEDIWRFNDEDCFELFIAHVCMNMLDGLGMELVFNPFGTSRETLIDSKLVNTEYPDNTDVDSGIIAACTTYLVALDDSPTRTEEEKQALKEMVDFSVEVMI